MTNKGFSLIEILIITALAGFVLAAISAVYVNLIEVDDTQTQLISIQERRFEIENYLKDPSKWSDILSLNPGLNCYESGASCGIFKELQPLKLQMGSVLLDGAQSDLGINKRGEFCNRFDELTGDDSCAVGIRPRWQMVCTAEDCSEAQPRIEIQFLYKSYSKSLALNMKPYEIVYYKSTFLQSKSEICQSLKGQLVNGKCEITALSQICSPNITMSAQVNFPLGFDNDGQVICGWPTAKTCSGTDILAGFNADGDAVCVAKCGN